MTIEYPMKNNRFDSAKMTRLQARVFSMLAGWALILSFSGCAGIRANQARVAVIEANVTQYQYNATKTSKAQVWASLRTMLFAQGYEVISEGTPVEGVYMLETAWRRGDSDSDGDRTDDRLMGTIVDVGNSHEPGVYFQVQLQRSERRLWDGDVTMSASRYYELEWELVNNVDPAWASQVQYEADVAGAAAREK